MRGGEAAQCLAFAVPIENRLGDAPGPHLAVVEQPVRPLHVEIPRMPPPVP